MAVHLNTVHIRHLHFLKAKIESTIKVQNIFDLATLINDSYTRIKRNKGTSHTSLLKINYFVYIVTTCLSSKQKNIQRIIRK